MPAEVLVKRGETAILQVAPGVWSRYQGRECTVTRIDDYGSIVLADVEFREKGSLDGSSVVVPGVPIQYLVPVRDAKDAKPRRRSPLNLAMPKDDRSEREKQTEAVTWLQSHGYIVLEVGQFRTQAVCHTCSRRQGRTVKVYCRDCGAPVFGTHTGSTEGTPDTFVTHPERYPQNVWHAQEWKQEASSERKPAQIALVQAGCSTFVWSMRMCLDDLHDFEMRDARIHPHPAVEEWLTAHGERPDLAAKSQEAA